MNKFKRIFLIVCDSLGCGYADDAQKFGDYGANTFTHIAEKFPKGLHIPNLEKLGVHDVANIKGTKSCKHPKSYVAKLVEISNGKDTMTGHWEMMGIDTKVPFKTFTDTGFPQELIDELEEKTGYKFIGNKAASGTEILKELGEQSMRDKSLIVYTSSDSVIQIAANEAVVPVPELYRVCEITREVVNRPEYRLGRVIARPFVGTDASNFKRTPNRHDLALSPTETTCMDLLKDANYETYCVGKIADIFNNVGVTKSVRTVSNSAGMQKTINIVENEDFTGLCFINLVEFDSEYGHRRNPIGYGQAIEQFDVELGEMLEKLHDDDLLLITADHGNDPTWHGTDHTREKVMLIAYSKQFEHGKYLGEIKSFGSIGKTVLYNFDVKPTDNIVGEVIKEYFEE